MSGPLAYLGVAVLGGLGALGRLHIGVLMARLAGTDFPWGTLAANLVAGLGAGWVAGLGLTGNALVLLSIGVFGSLSTFSTWMLETHQLAGSRRPRAALANIVLPLGAGWVAMGAGMLLGALA